MPATKSELALRKTISKRNILSIVQYHGIDLAKVFRTPGIDVRSLKRWLGGVSRKGKAETFIPFAELFGVDPSDIFNEHFNPADARPDPSIIGDVKGPRKESFAIPRKGIDVSAAKKPVEIQKQAELVKRVEALKAEIDEIAAKVNRSPTYEQLDFLLSLPEYAKVTEGIIADMYARATSR